MSEAKAGNQVKVHYKGTLTSGEEFDSSYKRNEPLGFTVGAGQMIKGFDEAVQGMKVGEKKTVNIPSAEAYGEWNEEALVTVPRERLPQDQEPKPGMQIAMQRQDGRRQPAVIKEVNEKEVVIDANHPLAGKDLVFEIELVEISEA